ncbi:MAG: glutamine--tRNA ligase/YqeY domain fusion protein [Candidatus Lambdaproteobacteria bacterium]|nr:glutamine--tRNA ligase/YqeY domain fusion protein [Candidatus Lambdaproteobacteria bacterium]
MSESSGPGNFIRTIIDEDLAAGRTAGRVVTRFPPEPNGYLHIGHAKSICLNFGLAQDYGGVCNLRFDDTNPLTEEHEYVASIEQDVRWLGFDWGERRFHASDYFERLYEFAVRLIGKGSAFVCDLSHDEVRDARGTLTRPGRPSPYRDRPVQENLALFARMRAGDFPDGSRTLRARIDMASPNLNLRDPVIYRIRRAPHYRTGDAWCIYPSYDWAHGQSDYIEGVTHSICTLEFQDHRPLYEWFLEQLDAQPRPRQIEFARLNLAYAVMSKRLLQQLVRERVVSGWDDPRMPTLSGLRRRGVTPEAIRQFCAGIGVAKADSLVDMGFLESCIRKDLEPATPRVMCVHDPLRVVLTNWPQDRVLELEAPYFPDESGRQGTRLVPLSRELFIEREDFMEDPPKGFFRLSPGGEVRLRRAYVIRCDEVLKDAAGTPVELRCSVDLETLNAAPVGRKVRGIIHWVSARHALPAQVRLYDRLFAVPNPTGDKEGDFKRHLNPDALQVLAGAMAEPSLAAARPGERYQFERKGFYFVDPLDAAPGKPVFNRIVTLRDTWARLQDQQGPPGA